MSPIPPHIKFKSFIMWHIGIQILLLLAFDIEVNPGPVKDPCGICSKAVTWSDKGVNCSDCEVWFHASCVHMRTIVYDLEQSGVPWHCWNCGLPNFSSEIFANVPADSIHPSLQNISRASSLTTTSSVHPPSPLSTSEETSSDLSPGRNNQTPPLFSTPIHSVSPPNFKTPPNQDPSSKNSPSRRPATVKHNKSLRTIVLNFQSIRNKKASLLNLIDSANPDLIIGSETWLKPTEHSSEFFPPNYVVYRKDRPDGYGGCLLAVKTDFISHEIHHSTKAEAVYVQIKTDGRERPLVVGSIYRPPSTKKSEILEQVQEITKSMDALNKRDTIWIGGDLNLPDIDWRTNEINGNRNPRVANVEFVEKLGEYNLHQVVENPTRGENILDIFCTNKPNLVQRTKLLPGLSDHDAILVESRIKAQKNKPIAHTVSIWKKANFEAIKAETEAFATEFNKNPPETVEKQWESIRNHLLDMMKKHVPTKKRSTKFHQPWINNTIKRLARKKQRAWKKAKRTGEQQDWNRFKSLKKDTRRECRKAYQGYVRSFIEEDSGKHLWRFIKSKKTDTVGVAPLKKNGLIHSTGKEKANILNDQFGSVFTNEDLDNLPDLGDSPFPPMPDINITTDGVEKLLKKLNTRKAAGPDGIPCRLLQCVSKELAPALTTLFTKSLDSGQVPKDWRHALVQPIYKKGDRSNPANYRPISLTCVCCKLMEHIVRSHVTRHLETENILSDAQHGFRKKRSCETQLLLTIDDLARELDKGGQTDTILLDYAKAFDKVPHQRLIMKLHHYGIRGQPLLWIQSFLANRTQQVVVEGEVSNIGEVTSGVPQGSVLGPTLFLAYINDIGDNISAKVRLFADDTILYRHIRDSNDTHALQQDLERLQTWEATWQMEFNVSKCHVLSVTMKKKPTQPNYHLHGQKLEQVDSAKYLGVEITSKLHWGKHIHQTAAKANRTSGFICRNLKGCPTPVQSHCYKALVRPILDYASPVWDPYQQDLIDTLEATQRRTARRIYQNFDRQTSGSTLVQRLELPTLKERRAIDKVAMVYKIVNNEVDIQASNFYTPATRQLRGQQNKFQVPQSRLNVHLHSFVPSSTRLWNSIPQSAMAASSVSNFKEQLKEWAKKA